MSGVPPPDPTRLLSRLRDEAPRAPVDARARVRARLSASVSGGGGGGASARAPAAGAGAVAVAARGWRLAAAAFVAGGALGAAAHAAWTPALEPRVVYVERSAPPAPPTSGTAFEVIEVPSVATSAPVAPAAPRASASSDPSQLAAERAALDEVRALLVQGDPDAALERLRAAARRFPRPVLGEERDALTIEALVAVGRYDEARARADAFRKRAPGSLFQPTVNSAIRAIPDAGSP